MAQLWSTSTIFKRSPLSDRPIFLGFQQGNLTSLPKAIQAVFSHFLALLCHF